MPKAEVGSTKYIANKMKAKGLQRLRWYCQICEKQCRDENGFKQHTQSEGHVRAMLVVGEDAKRHIAEYSRRFQHDFLTLLKSSRNEKKVNLNHFYQEYIRDKEHVHMNATRWPSLTEFAKHLGREGICRVEEGEHGLEIQWIDDSADAIRRREEIRRRDRLAKGEEEVESRLLEEQMKRARETAEKMRRDEATALPPTDMPSEPVEVVKVSLSLKGKGVAKAEADVKAADAPVVIETLSSTDQPVSTNAEPPRESNEANEDGIEKLAAPPTKVSLSLSAKAKPSNPLTAKNPFAKKKSASVALSASQAPAKKMSNTERIMMEELERKRRGEQRGTDGRGKRPRLE